MPLIRTAEADTHTMHGVSFTALVNTTTGAAQLASCTARFDPHSPGHEHRVSEEEIFHIMAGTLDVEVEGEALIASVGDCVLVPARARLRVSNLGDHPATAWIVTTVGLTASLTADGTLISPPWAQ